MCRTNNSLLGGAISTFTEPTGHRRLTSSRRRPDAPKPPFVGRRRRTLRSFIRTASHGIVRGAATALGAGAVTWGLWWIQQR